jgi:acyl carrier protein
MNMELEERIRKLVAKQMRIPVDNVTIDSTFEQLGMDSLDGVNLLFEVEEEFDISIDDDASRSIKSVREMVNGIEMLLERKSANTQAAQHD